MKRRDPETQLRLVKLEFNKDKTPLENGETTHIGCMLTDPVIQGLLRGNEGSNKLSNKVAQAHGMSRGRGRGRGRGGKSRGR
mmetsp:Transcript_35891/g.57268  ORF Transcript_35891/g.57268 Transcript_35891/m.57268 type:complete len:82 (-) Transcript_35891:54-299(-)